MSRWGIDYHFSETRDAKLAIRKIPDARSG
jgi:hypothetical protein